MPLTGRRGAEKAFPYSASQGRIFQALTGRTPVIFLYILFGFFRKRLSAFRFFFPSRSKSHQSRRHKKQILRAPPCTLPQAHAPFFALQADGLRKTFLFSFGYLSFSTQPIRRTSSPADSFLLKVRLFITHFL